MLAVALGAGLNIILDPVFIFAWNISKPAGYTGKITVKTTQAPGTTVYGENGVTIDASNASQGYVTVSYTHLDVYKRQQQYRCSLGCTAGRLLRRRGS